MKPQTASIAEAVSLKTSVSAESVSYSRDHTSDDDGHTDESFAKTATALGKAFSVVFKRHYAERFKDKAKSTEPA